ncbi:MAG TPA: VCBS repeat-containing protein, partial [Methylomirabilota bacterium]|nr:VCBS repeat-containing protein [Methylomirabilota bacterium]
MARSQSGRPIHGSKKKRERALAAKRNRNLVVGLIAGILVAALGVSWAVHQRSRKAPAYSGGTAESVNAPEVEATASKLTPAQMMMGGGDPRKDYVPEGPLPPPASKRDRQPIPPVVLAPEEQIKLDPVCDKMFATTLKFAPGTPAPSTRRMAERLAEIYEKADPRSAAYHSEKLAAMIHTRMTNASELNEQFRLQFSLAIQQINTARPDSALNTFSELERMVAQTGGQLDKRTIAELRIRKAIAFFRLGEQENCLATHNADSCVFPLKPKAFHLLPRGSQGAIALFNSHLAEYPNDYTSRWLLNLAHMTLGEYPDKVNPEYLIPPKTFDSEYDMPRFPDVSDGLGVDANDLAGGVIVDDFDNDGFYDLVISAWDHKGQLRYFRNNQDGTFKERTSEAGLVGEVGSLNIQQTDYNNDGWLDIWMLRGAWLGTGGRIPNSLLRNNGDGTFTDVTEQARLLSFHPTQASRWFDFDGDGWLDVFIGNESTDPRDPDWCELYRNNRDGTFTECAKEVGIRVKEFVKGVACGDYDNDGRPDLYLSVRGQRAKILLHNDGPDASGQWRFSNRAAEAKVNNTILSFGTFFFDYNNDGWEDLVLFGYYFPGGIGEVAKDYLGLPNQAETPRLYRNNKDGTFTDVTKDANMNRVCHTMGHNYGDLDNDGYLDCYLGTGEPTLTALMPNRMFRNLQGQVFQDVTTSGGFGHLQKGHGIAFADFDGDGDQDIYEVLGGAY